MATKIKKLSLKKGNATNLNIQPMAAANTVKSPAVEEGDKTNDNCQEKTEKKLRYNRHHL